MKKVLVLFFLLSVSALFGQLTVATTAIPNPIVAKAISGTVWTLNATGGTQPYTWAVVSGSLPGGLSLSSTGAIIGTPTTTGAATFSLRVTDSTSATASKSFTVTTQNAIGHGCTTATVIDWDCDYYGVGSAIGPDADDNDATVNTPASMLAKYGTLANFLSMVKGYSPKNIWYVSTSGNDSACRPNNVALPCASWFKAAGSMSAGDMIMVRAGTYYEEAANPSYANFDMPSGTAGNQNYAMAYPGEKAILSHNTAGWYGIEFATYVTVDGLVIANPPCASPVNCGMGINFSGPQQITNVVIRNCEIRDTYRGIWGIGGQANTLIEKNIMHDNGGEHNIYLGNNTDSAPHQNSTVIIRYNILYNAAWDNFHFNGLCTGCLLDSNIMYSANMVGGGGSANIAFNQGWNHSTVSNNVVFNASAYAFSITDYDDGQPAIVAYDQNYNLIVNNTFIFSARDSTGQNLTAAGFTAVSVMNNSATPHDMGHNTWSNNIFADITNGTGSGGNGVMRYLWNDATDPGYLASDTWTNDVLYTATGAALSYGQSRGGSVPPQVSFNFFSSTAGTFRSNIQSNPSLVALNAAWYSTPEAFNLTPLAGSPAIGAGTTAGAPATDIQGNVRSAPVAIGAYALSVPQNGGSVSPCDLNNDGVVNSSDATIAISQALGSTQCSTADLVGDGTCTVVDVQRVINAALGGVCRYH